MKLPIINLEVEIRISSSLKRLWCKAKVAFILLVFLFSAHGFYFLPRGQNSQNPISQLIKPKEALANYQFAPTGGAIVTGTAQTITSATVASAEGVNVGSWKGTLADDAFHWTVASTATGVNFYLDLDGVQLKGANKLIIQTEIDLDATVPQLLVQICDWFSATSVDNAADAQCTTGGWRTLNTKNASQAAVAYTDTANDAMQWHIYDSYWSTGTTGGTPVSTPLTNFVSGTNKVRVRYFSTTNTVSVVSIDYLRVYAVVDPVYHPAEFVNQGTGTPAGHYGGAVVVGNTATGQQAVTGDALYLSVPGTAGSVSDFYLKFKNVKTYTGANTILANTDVSCSAATAGLQYRYAIRNFTGSTWEDISNPVDCGTADLNLQFAKNNVTLSNYINGSNEIWVRVYGLSNSTTSLRVDQLYLTLGTTNTDLTACEISFGSNISGRIAANYSAPGADQILATAIDSTYMYLAGFDTSGGDNQWHLEKRNLSDGALVTAFDTDGIVTTDPSTGSDQILAIAVNTTHVFVAGFDNVPGNNQWRIEKRDIGTGALVTAFDTDGIIQFNPAADIDQITAIALDASAVYVAGFEDDDTGVWRIHKYDITTGALVTAFDTDGIITETLLAGAGNERIQAMAVDATYLYVAGFDILAGAGEWRIEKRNLSDGALVSAFDTDGIVNSDPSINADAIYAMAIDSAYIYVAGYDGVVASTNFQWRIEKRDITTGALVTAFDTDGAVQVNPAADNDWVTTLDTDASNLYVGGFVDDDTGTWRAEKRNISTGALVTAFDADGIVTADDGGDDRLTSIAADAANVYLAGWGTGPGNNQWLIEKRDVSTGLRVTASFGTNDCSATRNIDTTANPSMWNVQTEDESTTFGHDYYPLNTDADATVEEAAATNISFAVTAPSNAAVTGVFFAGRYMGGDAGTVQMGLRDYGSLTGTLGGWSAIGASATIAMVYSDNRTVGTVASGGVAGWMTNPEDFIDTVNNKMNINVRTTADGATTNNSVRQVDFAMVSLQWIETAAAAPTFTLNSYRWYVDSDALDVTDPWGTPDIAQATAIAPLPASNDPPGPTQELRLRVNFTVNTANLSASGQQFKLQYKAGTDASCTTGSWTDAGAGGGGTIWRFATSAVTDGTTLTISRLSPASDVLEVYAKANPSATNPNAATVGQEIEYDFHIEQNGAAEATQYSFRAVESDGTVFDAYTNCPTLTSEPGTSILQRHGNFFADEIEKGFFWAN